MAKPGFCAACGRQLETHEYQTRSADEAHTVVTTCSKCPVDANKLNSTASPLHPDRGLAKPIKRMTHNRVRSAGCEIGLTDMIWIEIPRTHRYNALCLDTDHVTVSQNVMCVTRAGNMIAAEGIYSINGPLENKCTTRADTLIIGYGASCKHYVTYSPQRVDHTFTKLIRGKYAEVETICGNKAYVYQETGSMSRHVLVDATKTMSHHVMKKIIDVAYGIGLIPTSLKQYIKNSDISLFSNKAARAWDTSMPPDSGYTFTSKPDGERVWLVMYGSTWYVSQPRFKGTINEWKLNKDIDGQSTRMIVIDVEYVATYGYILIDMLTAADGTLSDDARDITWVIEECKSVLKKYPTLSIHIRSYFDMYTDAVQYTDRVPYQCDGLVAVRNGSTESLKIKDVKSIELCHIGSGVLTSSNNAVIATVPEAASFNEGAVLELRFTVDNATKEVRICDVFQRTDKEMANSTEAVLNVFQSATVNATPYDNERRAALLWCNMVRDKLHKDAAASKSNKCIILDVGTGDGQSLDSMKITENVSRILVEPDAKKCQSLARRLGVKRILSNPADLVPMIRSLTVRSIQHVIVNCSLHDFLIDPDALLRLLPELKCITCTYSAQYVVSELHTISTFQEIPIYGCMYLYDSRSVDGVLIDTCGVKMSVSGNGIAAVTWGRDTYDEPATCKSSYAGLGRVIPASNLIPLPDVNVSQQAAIICSNVWMLVP